MPNHVTNIIEAAPEVIAALRGADGKIDFNQMIPYPEELTSLLAEYKVFPSEKEAEAYNAQERAQRAAYPHTKPDTIYGVSADRHRELVKKYGPNLDWYHWDIANWGTKWNAYDEGEALYTTTNQSSVAFDTAWSHPKPVIAELSRRFPDETLTVHFADEDLGYNLGSYTIRNGELEHVFISSDSATKQDSLDFAAKVKWGRDSYAELAAEWAEEDED